MTEHEEVRPRVTTGRAFVGRERELAELMAGLEDAAAGRGRLFLIAGEPGIGKTRLAEELAGHAARSGAPVVWGRCWESGGTPAYWPWMQVIRSCRQSQGAGAPSDGTADRGDFIQMLPQEARERIPAHAAPALTSSPGQDEHARFYLFDAVTTFLKEVSRRNPLVLILDDLHAADRASLLLLRFLARELRDAHLLLLGSYREFEAKQHPDLDELLGEIAGDGRQIPLRGLSESEVASMIEAAVGFPPSASTISAVYSATEGNPFFVDEVLGLLVSEGLTNVGETTETWKLRIPRRVRDAIHMRLRALPEECRSVLAAAAVIGREFDVACLEGVCGLSRGAFLHVVDEVRTAGILQETGRGGSYRFSHSLIPEVLYSDLGTTCRAELHRDVARTLERQHRSNLEPYLVDLARHFYEAVSTGREEKALEYSRRAARQAMEQLAYEEAAAHLDRALALLPPGAAHDVERCEVLLDLGDALLRSVNPDRTRQCFSDAAELAKSIGAAESLARAAIGFSKTSAMPGSPTARGIDLLEQALAALGEGSTSLHAIVIGQLSMALYISQPSRALSLGDAAVEAARRAGDPRIVALALHARLMARWGPESSQEAITTSTEILEIGRQINNREFALEALHWRLRALMELGDTETLDRELEAFARAANELRQPRYLWLLTLHRQTRAFLDGKFEEAERLGLEALEMSRRSHPEEGDYVAATQTLWIRWAQGRLAEHEATLRGQFEQFPQYRVQRSALTFIHAELGRRDAAQSELERLAKDDFADIPRDAMWMTGVAFFAKVCAFIGDQRRAAVLYDLLLPFEGKSVVIQHGAYFGSVSHYLGILAATLGRWDDANRHFEAALATEMRMRARPFVAWTEYEYGTTLLARGNAGDPERASRLHKSALATAKDIGMARLIAKIQEAGGPIPEEGVEGAAFADHAHGTAAATASAPTRTLFRREGDYWTIGVGGDVVRLRDTKGLRYIAQLLRHPRVEMHAAELAGIGYAGESGRPPLGDAGEIIDHQARESYRRRLDELGEELAEAERFNDLGRAATARGEIDGLTNELAAGVGLGGRARRALSDSERARVMVTKRIKLALRKIAKESPAVGRQLAKTIRTGIFCCYDPDPSLGPDFDV